MRIIASKHTSGGFEAHSLRDLFYHARAIEIILNREFTSANGVTQYPKAITALPVNGVALTLISEPRVYLPSLGNKLNG